jgi:hypothetical protein
MGEGLQPITALLAPDVRRADLTSKPDLEWVALEQLRVDRTYQRNLSERSVTLIRRIVREFDWARCRPAVGVRTDYGCVELLDGQHLATAAATHGGIEAIPVLIVEARPLASKAADFVSLNRDRVAMTPIAVFRAELASGDPVAKAVVDGLSKVGGKLLERPQVNRAFEIGETISVGALKQIAVAKGKNGVARVVDVLIKARRAPMSAMMLRAMQVLVWSREYAGELEDAAIAAVIVGTPQGALESRAKERAKAMGMPGYKALAQLIWQEATDG